MEQNNVQKSSYMVKFSFIFFNMKNLSNENIFCNRINVARVVHTKLTFFGFIKNYWLILRYFSPSCLLLLISCLNSLFMEMLLSIIKQWHSYLCFKFCTRHFVLEKLHQASYTALNRNHTNMLLKLAFSMVLIVTLQIDLNYSYRY